MTRVSLFVRVFVINAVLVTAAALALAVTPATVSAQLQFREVVVLALGVLAVLVVNFLLVRRSMIPLARLMALMERIDLTNPGPRIPATGGGREVEQLGGTFNEMLDRIEWERRDSARRAVEVQEHERRRIGLELHDEVGQLLTGVVLGLDGLARTLPDDSRDGVVRLQNVVRAGAEQVRDIARGLQPRSLEELGLRSALIAVTTTITEAGGLALERDIQTSLPPLPADVELAVFRVGQESLTNVARHAAASTVEVSVHVRDGQLELTIRDDGIGVRPGDEGQGNGIRGMRERALTVGGDLEVQPAEPRGTLVRLRVPVGEPPR